METGKTNIDFYYSWVIEHLVSKQTSALGLFPRVQYAHVRDNVICAVTLWAMSKALKCKQDGSGRLFEMEQLAVKTMRGILFCYSKQLDKLEDFKKHQNVKSALHTLFDPATGDEINIEWNHIQIHTVSLYLFYLSQMVRSGLTIVYTVEEFHIIQNLIYYIERSYRIKDFGTWGFGMKNNCKEPELSATNIGLSKCALESCNNLNLFGIKSSNETALFVDPDAVYRNDSIFNGLIPKESLSKNVDAALILVKGFPAFSVSDKEIVSTIDDNLDSELLGEYGYQRYVDDKLQLGEFKNLCSDLGDDFEHFEWPYLLIFQVISGMFTGDKESKIKYRNILNRSIFELDGFPALATVALVYRDRIELDKSAFPVFQALLILLYLLENNFIKPKDIDFRINDRKFKKEKANAVIQIALLAESTSFQQLLSTYGINTQTPNQIASVHIWPSSKLTKLLSHLGRNNTLGLTGRPPRPLGSLCTSRVWKIAGKTVVSVPLYQDKQDFYVCKDENYIAKSIKSHIKFLKNHWNSTKRPTFCLMLTPTLFKKDSKPLLEVLNMLKFGSFDGIPIKIGRLQELIPAAKFKVLDMHKHIKGSFDFHENRILASPKLFRRSLSIPSVDGDSIITSVKSRGLVTGMSYEYCIDFCKNKSSDDLCSIYSSDDSALALKVVALISLSRIKGSEFLIHGLKIIDHIQHYYKTVEGDWLVLRLCGGYLGKSVDSLAPSLATIVVSDKAVCFGKMGFDGILVTGPLHPKLLDDIFHKVLREQDVLHVCLQQEFLISLAEFIDEKPYLFNGINVLRIGWIISILTEILLKSNIHLEYLPPFQLQRKIVDLLSEELTSFYCSNDECFTRTRILNGTLGRVPNEFYKLVWQFLDCQKVELSLGSKTISHHNCIGVKPDESSFALLVEHFMSEIQDCIVRHNVIEMFQVLATISQRSPELKLKPNIDVSELLAKCGIESNDSFDVFSQKLIRVLVNGYFAVDGCKIS